MALTAEQKVLVAILRAQGETDARIAAFLGVALADLPAPDDGDLDIDITVEVEDTARPADVHVTTRKK